MEKKNGTSSSGDDDNRGEADARQSVRTKAARRARRNTEDSTTTSSNPSTVADATSLSQQSRRSGPGARDKDNRPARNQSLRDIQENFPLMPLGPGDEPSQSERLRPNGNGGVDRETPVHENYKVVDGQRGTRPPHRQGSQGSRGRPITRELSSGDWSGMLSPRSRKRRQERNRDEMEEELRQQEAIDEEYGFPKIPFTKEGFCILREHLQEPGGADGNIQRRYWRLPEEEDIMDPDDDSEAKSVRKMILRKMIKVGKVKAFLKPREGETLNRRRLLVKWNSGQFDSSESEHLREELVMIIPPGEATAWFRKNQCDHAWSLATVIYTVTLAIMAFVVAFEKSTSRCAEKPGTDPAICSGLEEAQCTSEAADLSDWEETNNSLEGSVDPDPFACIWIPAEDMFFMLVPPIVCIGVMIAMTLIYSIGLINDFRHNASNPDSPIDHGFGFGKNWGAGTPGSELAEKPLPIGHEKGDIPDPGQCAARCCRFCCCFADDDHPLEDMAENLDANRLVARTKPRV